jgi:hypothetical protein
METVRLLSLNIVFKVPAEDRVRFQVCLFEISGGQDVTETLYPLSTSVVPCQYHSTVAPYSFIHLPHTLYNVFLPVLQFSPVIIIPPLLHTHSFIYHPRYLLLTITLFVK